MKTIKILLFLSLLGGIVLTSCGDDGNKDKERPVIKIITPESNAIVVVGTDLIFKANFSDNEALASYKIDIHINEGSHNHSMKLPKAANIVETTPFSYTKSAGLSGKTVTVEEKISIPFKVLDTSDNKEKPVKGGTYHLVVYLLDQAGNESIVIQDFVIDGKENALGVNIITPKENEVIYIGSDFTFKANFFNQEGLASYKVAIQANNGKGSYLATDLPKPKSVTESTFYSYNKSANISGTSYTANDIIDIPLTTLDISDNKRKKVQPGNYFLIVYLTDRTGYESVVIRNIKLSN